MCRWLTHPRFFLKTFPCVLEINFIASYVIFRFKEAYYMPAYVSWGRQPSVYVSSSGKVPPIEDKSPYLKPIVVVIDRGTFSAAEDFCALFRGMNRGLIAGTPPEEAQATA